MREIKFRARASDGSGFKYFKLFENDENYILPKSGKDGEVDEKSVQQYTGLKDKNGKEIYEGDIIKRRNGEIGPVEFEEGSFVIKRIDYMKSEYIEWPSFYFYECFVIGNIHENPGLLK